MNASRNENKKNQNIQQQEAGWSSTCRVLAECVQSLGLDPALHKWSMVAVCKPKTQKTKQEDKEVKVILIYVCECQVSLGYTRACLTLKRKIIIMGYISITGTPHMHQES